MRFIIYRICENQDENVIVSHPRCDGGYLADSPEEALEMAIAQDEDEELFPPGLYLVAPDVEERPRRREDDDFVDLLVHHAIKLLTRSWRTTLVVSEAVVLPPSDPE